MQGGSSHFEEAWRARHDLNSGWDHFFKVTVMAVARRTTAPPSAARKSPESRHYSCDFGLGVTLPVTCILIFYSHSTFGKPQIAEAADPLKTANSKLPSLPVDNVLSSSSKGETEAAAANNGGSKFVQIPKAMIRGLKESMVEVRERQEALIKHLECNLSSAGTRCNQPDKAPLKLDWTSYIADDQTPLLLEISHFFREDPIDLPIEIITPIMQMFNGAVTELYVKQRYISNLFEQTACNSRRGCGSLKSQDGDRLIPNVYEWFSSLFKPFSFSPFSNLSLPPFPPFLPSLPFGPSNIFAGHKPCFNDTMSGTFNNGSGIYFSTILQYGTNCSSFQHTINNKTIKGPIVL